MKRHILAHFVVLFCTFAVCTSSASAQQADPHQLGVLDEKVNRLNAQVEDLQFRQQQMQKDLEGIRADVQELRRATGAIAPNDIKSLEDRIAAVDAARQRDKQAIIDQLAKELAAIGAGKPGNKPVPTTTGDAKEYIVQKGETLTSIAKATGVTVADLKKANGLSGDDIKPGQRLVIPK
jgi:LysM repeat protein